MRNSIILLFIVFVFFSCNSDKWNAVKKLNKLEKSVDSINTVYNAIDWEQYKDLSNKMNLQIDFVKQNTEIVMQVDSSFIQYFGPYSTAGKMLSRVFKKQNSKIEVELELAKTQISNLKYDIKNEIIQNTDSIVFFINSEQMAVSRVIKKIENVQSSLNKQVEAYDLIHLKVDSLIDVAKKIIKIDSKQNSNSGIICNVFGHCSGSEKK